MGSGKRRTTIFVCNGNGDRHERALQCRCCNAARADQTQPENEDNIMTETADSSLLCPFTLKPISSAKRDDVAVLCQNNPLLTPPTENHCGHSCTLSKLVPYLHDGSAAKLCPVCQTLPVTFICDHQSYTFLDHWHQMHAYEKRDGSSDGFGGKIVTFRYGSTSYFLWVHSQSPQSSSCSNLFGSGSNAMDRINKVLGVKHGLKVSLYDGLSQIIQRGRCIAYGRGNRR